MAGDEHRRADTGGIGLLERMQRTGTMHAGFSIGLVTLFAVLAILVAAPSIIEGAPQIGVPLVALSVTISLLADMLRPDLGRYAMWLRLVSLAVAVAAVALLSVQFLA